MARLHSYVAFIECLISSASGTVSYQASCESRPTTLRETFTPCTCTTIYASFKPRDQFSCTSSQHTCKAPMQHCRIPSHRLPWLWRMHASNLPCLRTIFCRDSLLKAIWLSSDTSTRIIYSHRLLYSSSQELWSLPPNCQKPYRWLSVCSARWPPMGTYRRKTICAVWKMFRAPLSRLVMCMSQRRPQRCQLECHPTLHLKPQHAEWHTHTKTCPSTTGLCPALTSKTMQCNPATRSGILSSKTFSPRKLLNGQAVLHPNKTYFDSSRTSLVMSLFLASDLIQNFLLLFPSMYSPNTQSRQVQYA